MNMLLMSSSTSTQLHDITRDDETLDASISILDQSLRVQVTSPNISFCRSQPASKPLSHSMIFVAFTSSLLSEVEPNGFKSACIHTQ